MNQSNCDFSPMKQTVKDELSQVIMSLQQSIEAMDTEANCLLSDFEKKSKRNLLRLKCRLRHSI